MKKIILISIIALLVCALTMADDIHQVCKNGDLSQAQKLLEENPELVNAFDDNQQTPLHHAVEGGNLDIVSFLVEKGADVNSPNYMKYTPLHYASISGQQEIAEYLISAGANLNLKTARDRTALHLAAAWGKSLPICKALVENGADMNITSDAVGGYSPLGMAISFGNEDIADYFLDQGAKLPQDIYIIHNCLADSARYGLEKAFEKLAVAAESFPDLSLNDYLFDAVQGDSKPILRKIIDSGAEINKPNRYGYYPIHIASKSGIITPVEVLIEKGSDINVLSPLGKTALHYAEELENKELIQLLKANGARELPVQFPVLKQQYPSDPLPTDIPLIFANGIVSTMSNEHSSLTFSPDMNTLLWTEQYRGPIMQMERINGVWTSPKPAAINSEFGDGEPMFWPDGKRIYFLSFRPIEEGGSAKKENIWYVEKTESGWSEAKPVSPNVNSMELHWQISFSSDKTLYFTSTSAGGHGSNDIYYSKFIEGEYQEPVNLGSIINSPRAETTPFIAPDESYLIYAANDRNAPEDPGISLYISFKDQNGIWNTPIHLKSVIKLKGTGMELCPSITPDGKYLSYISGDIYWMPADFINKLRPSATE